MTAVTLPVATRDSAIAPAPSAAVAFEENRGQVDARVRYIAHAADTTVFLTATEAVYAMPMPGSDGKRAFALRMRLAGANAEAMTPRRGPPRAPDELSEGQRLLSLADRHSELFPGPGR